MRWTPNNSIIKELILNNEYNEEYINNSENPERLKKIISYYRCIYLNGLSSKDIKNINRKINSGEENNEWTDINLTKTEKIKQQWNEFEEDHPNVAQGAKFVGESLGTAGVVTGVSAAVLVSMGLLSAVIGGKKSKKNMKRRNKKRVTRNNKKPNTRKNAKKTRKGVKRAKKIRNTKKQILGKK
jgi:hypothetical protein